MSERIMQDNKRTKGFTLVEIMVVVLIIAMLATFLAPKVFKKFGKAKRNIALTGISLIESSLESFAADCGRFPSQDESLGALRSAPADMEENKWDGPYLKKSQLNDPWGNPYIYIEDGQINPGSYDVISYGADGQLGGENENADIYNE